MSCEVSQRVRSHRLVWVLAALCVLHAFDLGFTQTQVERGNFHELNQLAACVVDSPTGLVTYKSVLFGAGVFILYRTRRHWQAECGAWFLLAVSSGLMVWWVVYLKYVDICLTDPVTVAPAFAF